MTILKEMSSKDNNGNFGVKTSGLNMAIRQLERYKNLRIIISWQLNLGVFSAGPGYTSMESQIFRKKDFHELYSAWCSCF
jgi:hypothetical protein